MVFPSLDSAIPYGISSSLFLLSLNKPERKKHENLFKLMLEEVQDYAIFTIDPEGTIVSWNPGARYLIGFTEKEIIGKPLSTLFPDLGKKSHLHKDLEMAVKKGQYEHITQIVKKNKKKIFVNCVVTALWGNDNQLKGFSKIVQDITPQMEAERIREEFIAMAGHELKNPITSIKSYLQLVELKLTRRNETELTLLLTKTISQVNKLNNLIRDILDTSRIASGKLPFRDNDTIRIDTFIQDIIDTIRVSYSNHQFSFNKTLPITISHVDKERVEQAIINILMNAVKYSPQKSIVSISTHNTSKYYTIAIKDKGIGIPKKEQKNIFTRYFRGENAKNMQQGLGIGLHLAYAVIAHYNGTIAVESKEGKGSTFFILLPKSLIKND